MATTTNLNELKARGELREDDKVVFTVDGTEHEYMVPGSHLNKRHGANDRIFHLLGMNEDSKKIFARAAYVYPHDRNVNGDWPEYRRNDFAAATRLVEAIYKKIAERDAASSTEKKRVPGQRALINTAADVDAYAPLEVGDRVFFQRDGVEFSVQVQRDGVEFSVQVQRDSSGYYCRRGCSERGQGGDVFDHPALDNGRNKGDTAARITGIHSGPLEDGWPQYEDQNTFTALVKGLLMAYGQIGEVAKSENAAELKEGDEFEFTLRGETLKYRAAKSSPLSSAGEGFYGFPKPLSEQNKGKVFKLLEIHPGAFIEEVTGVRCKDFSDPWPSIPTLADFNKVVRALRERCATAQVIEPTGPRTITNVEELRAAMPLSEDDIVILDGKTLSARRDSRNGWFCFSAVNEASLIRRLAGQSSQTEYVEALVGYEPGEYLWPQVRSVEDLAKVIEDLMIRAGQGERPYAEGDVLRHNSSERYVRILDVEDQGRRFFLSDDHTTLENLRGDRLPRLGGEYADLEELRANYTLVIPAAQADSIPNPAPAEEPLPTYSVGDLLYDPEDHDYARVLGVDGAMHLLSDWTHDLKDEKSLSDSGAHYSAREIKDAGYTLVEFLEGDLLRDGDGDYRRILGITGGQRFFVLSTYAHDPDSLTSIPTGGAWTLQEVKTQFTRINAATLCKPPLKLTRQQIAEKFGVEPDQIQITDEAA